MPAFLPLYQEVFQRIRASTDRRAVPRAAVRRLALLVTGVIAARSCRLRQVAAHLDALAVTEASRPEHSERRLRRTLQDRHLESATGYLPVLHEVLDGEAVQQGRRPVVLAVATAAKKTGSTSCASA